MNRQWAKPCWRIDELAQRAGLTVDTIRYYSREGLLQTAGEAGPQPPLRPGAPRPARPDPRAPEPALLARRDPGHRRRRPPRPRRPLHHVGPRVHARRAHRAGRARRRARAGLRDVGLLPDPSEFGGDAYDDTDLGVLPRGRRAALDRHDARDPVRARPHLRRPLQRAATRRARHALRARRTPRGTPTSSSRSSNSSTVERAAVDARDEPGAELRAPTHVATPHARSRAHARSDAPRRRAAAELEVEAPDASGVAAGDA